MTGLLFTNKTKHPIKEKRGSLTFHLWSMFSECRWSFWSISQTLSSVAPVPTKYTARFLKDQSHTTLTYLLTYGQNRLRIRVGGKLAVRLQLKATCRYRSFSFHFFYINFTYIHTSVHIHGLPQMMTGWKNVVSKMGLNLERSATHLWCNWICSVTIYQLTLLFWYWYFLKTLFTVSSSSLMALAISLCGAKKCD